MKMNEDLIIKVKKELSQNYKLTMRRYEFLKTMNIEHRPWNYAEVVGSWDEAILQYDKSSFRN